MSNITKTKTWADNDLVQYTDLNSNFDTIYTEFNGNIDNTNVKSGAAIAYSKLSLTGSVTDTDINASAAITTTKISGTAMNLSSDQTVTGVKTFDKEQTLKNISSPSAPAAGYNKLYFKSGSLYKQNSSGTEAEIAGFAAKYAKVRRNSNLTISSGTLITWDIEELDNDSMVNLGASNNRITIVTSGIYRVTLHVTANNTTSNGYVASDIYVNGARAAYDLTSTNVAYTVQPTVTVTNTLSLTAGDYVQGYAIQVGGLTELIGDDSSKTWMSVVMEA